MNVVRTLLVVCGIVLLASTTVGCRERPKPDEFVLDRYKDTGYLLLSFPSTSDPHYKKLKSDPERTEKLFIHEFEFPAVIIVVGGESGEVFDGPLLDNESVKYLVETYKLDPSVVTWLVVRKDGSEAERTTGDGGKGPLDQL